MLRVIALILNVILVGLGILSIFNLAICAVIGGLGGGLINIFTLLKQEVPAGFEKASLVCNGFAILVGLFSIPTAYGYLFGAESAQPGAFIVGIISAGIVTVFISAGIVTGIYVSNRY